MTDVPYFDRKSYLKLGMSQHAVDALETAFERTGGSSIVILNQSELEILLEGGLSALEEVRSLRERLDSLIREVEAMSHMAWRLAI